MSMKNIASSKNEYFDLDSIAMYHRIALRCITTPPILLVPGWTGFNIVLRKNVVVLESKISYLDTLDSPATDIKTAYEVLCRACAIKERLGLESVLCVLDQAFYAKAAEVIWKNKDI